MLVAAASCGRAYREPPDVDPAARRGETGPTVVGQVSPEGEVRADTLAGVEPDTARVDRETVVTGAIVQEPTEVGAPGVEVPAGPWRVQIFAARDEASAQEVARRARAAADAPAWVDPQDGWYKVRVGGYADRAVAETLRQRLIGLGFAEAFLVRATGS